MKRKQIGASAFLLVFIALVASIMAGPLSGTADQASRRDGRLAVFLAGDSTVSQYDGSKAPRMGWGQVISEHFDSEVLFLNHASPGRSSKSFIDEGRLDAIWAELREGDYLFIQFGHNDAKSEDPLRYTEPATSYKNYLMEYIDGAKVRGAIPVLVTSVERRRFDSAGNAVATHEPYRLAMIELARQEQIQLIDLNTKSRTLFQELGPEGTRKLFMLLEPGQSPNYPHGVKDNTHFSEAGARQMAMLVADGIMESSLEPLKQHIMK